MVAQKAQLSGKTEKMSLIVKRNRFSSAVALNRELSMATGIGIFTQNLRNRLYDAGLQLSARRPAVRRRLTVKHRNCRHQFAQDRINCHLHPIQGVLWTAVILT